MLPLGPNGWIGISPIETLAARACEPSLGEPPYHLHLELAEMINSKKANTPREAAHATLRLINSRNPHTSLLALSLLNSLVNNCGYPMHLQISTKEFLNELVKRFPERPPPYPGPVMARILELINEWKETICTESRWKEDFSNIRDMWRLLSFKGYRFKERRRDTTEAPSTSTLKSADELENEDRVAQEAKLQELIRRGTPRDLAVAQDLMKVLAGAEPDRIKKPDYKAQVLTELNKLESKVILMVELLDNASQAERKEKFVKGDVYDQVASILITARPKLQKWIAEAQSGTESGEREGDAESLDTFLTLNDQINGVLNRYEAYKSGDWSLGSVPIELSGPPAKSDLIDLDLESSSAPTGGGGGSTADDLMGLFSSPPPSTQSPPPTQHQPIDLSKLYGSPPPQSQSQFGATNLFDTTTSTPFGQTHFGGGPAAMGGGIMLPGTPIPGSVSGSTGTTTMNGGGAGAGAAPKGKDAFADLADLF